MDSLARKVAQQERFTNQKRFVASRQDCANKWGGDGKGFKCDLCGHRFVVGDGVRWVYAGSTGFCNFMTCDGCDGPDVLERHTAAGNFAMREALYALVETYGDYSRAAEFVEAMAKAERLVKGQE